MHAEGADLRCVQDNALLCYGVFIKAIYKPPVIVGPEVQRAGGGEGSTESTAERVGKKPLPA